MDALNRKGVRAKRIRSRVVPAICAGFLAVGGLAGATGKIAELERLKPIVLTYSNGDDFSPFAEATESLRGLSVEERIDAESVILKLLDRPGVTPAGRIEILRMLELVAGPASAEVLGPYLIDRSLSHPARRILQNLDSELVVKLFLAAINNTEGDLRIGLIGSLGRQQSEAAIVPLTELAASEDDATASAAIEALGETGRFDACMVLNRLVVQGALEAARLDAMLKAAEQLRRNRSLILAKRIARQLTGEVYPPLVRVGAYHLLARIEPDTSAEVTLELLNSDDPELVSAGLMLVADAKPATATAKFADLLNTPSIPGDILIQALVNRGDIAARSALLAHVNSENMAVRIAAVRALGPLGSPDELDLLIARLQADRGEAEAAMEALALIPQIEADIVLLRRYATFEDPPAADLAGVLALRDNRAAVPFMLRAALREDKVGRQSVRALATLARPSDVPELIALLDLVPVRYRRGIEQAAAAAMKRLAESPPSLAPVLGSLEDVSPENRASLIRIAGVVGGSEAAEVLDETYRSGNAEDMEMVSQIVANWPSESYVDLMLRVATETSDSNLRSQLIDALAEQANDWRYSRTEEATELLQALVPLASTTDEKRSILSAADGVLSLEALAIIEGFGSEPGLEEEAIEARERLIDRLRRADLYQ
jgi:HEAT repeat protein